MQGMAHLQEGSLRVEGSMWSLCIFCKFGGTQSMDLLVGEVSLTGSSRKREKGIKH